MKTSILKIFFAILTIASASYEIFPQDAGLPQETIPQTETEARLIDEFGKICSEDFAARYDGFLATLLNNPTATGYMVFHGDKTIEGTNLNFIAALMDYPKNRGLDMSRFKIIRGENQSEMFTQFWLVPVGAKTPKTERIFEKKTISTTTSFDRTLADFHKIFGKQEIYYDSFRSEWGCDFSPNISEFAKTLSADKNLTGYLVIYGNKKSRAERVVKFAVNDLVKNHKIPRSRLKTIYGGKSEDPQIEFWFVPKNDKPPIINSK